MEKGVRAWMGTTVLKFKNKNSKTEPSVSLVLFFVAFVVK